MESFALQDAFYIVGIVTMTLIAFLVIGIIIALLYIRSKISNLTDAMEKRFEEIKDVVTHPQRMAETVGGAIVDTASKQVEKLRENKKRIARS